MKKRTRKRLTEEIVADWRQKKKEGEEESPQIREWGGEGRGEDADKH